MYVSVKCIIFAHTSLFYVIVLIGTLKNKEKNRSPNGRFWEFPLHISSFKCILYLNVFCNGYPHKMHCFIMILQLMDIWFLQYYYYELLEDFHYISLSILLYHSLENQYVRLFSEMPLCTVLILFGSLIMKGNLKVLILSEVWPCSIWLLKMSRC